MASPLNRVAMRELRAALADAVDLDVCSHAHADAVWLSVVEGADTAQRAAGVWLEAVSQARATRPAPVRTRRTPSPRLQQRRRVVATTSPGSLRSPGQRRMQVDRAEIYMYAMNGAQAEARTSSPRAADGDGARRLRSPGQRRRTPSPRAADDYGVRRLSQHLHHQQRLGHQPTSDRSVLAKHGLAASRLSPRHASLAHVSSPTGPAYNVHVVEPYSGTARGDLVLTAEDVRCSAWITLTPTDDTDTAFWYGHIKHDPARAGRFPRRCVRAAGGGPQAALKLAPTPAYAELADRVVDLGHRAVLKAGPQPRPSDGVTPAVTAPMLALPVHSPAAGSPGVLDFSQAAMAERIRSETSARQSAAAAGTPPRKTDSGGTDSPGLGLRRGDSTMGRHRPRLAGATAPSRRPVPATLTVSVEGSAEARPTATRLEPAGNTAHEPYAMQPASPPPAVAVASDTAVGARPMTLAVAADRIRKELGLSPRSLIETVDSARVQLRMSPANRAAPLRQVGQNHYHAHWFHRLSPLICSWWRLMFGDACQCVCGHAGAC